MISLKNIEKSFGDKKILSGVSLEIQEGTFTTIFGPNGCGKSTLVNILSGLEAASSGEVLGADKLRGKVGYVFQDYRKSLLPWGNVEENILFPLMLRGVRKEDSKARLQNLLELTGLALDLKQPVISLSGGQAQAACILRALIIEPRLLILDEPFAALDYERTLSLREKLSEITTRLKLTVLFISHDLEEAILLGDRVVFLSKSPTKVLKILDVSIQKPRTAEVLGTEEFRTLTNTGLEIFKSSCGINSLA